MLTAEYLNKNANLKRDNVLLKFCVLCIGCTALFNTFFLLYTRNSQRIILTPSTITDRMEVGAHDASTGYINAMTREVINLALTYTSTNARAQFRQLLTIYASEGFQKAKGEYFSLADIIEKGQSSSVFYIQDIVINPKTQMVTIHGLRRQYIKDEKIEDVQQAYALVYVIQNGLFSIKALTPMENK